MSKRGGANAQKGGLYPKDLYAWFLENQGWVGVGESDGN